jgi:hypothetical protein
LFTGAKGVRVKINRHVALKALAYGVGAVAFVLTWIAVRDVIGRG